MILAKRPRSDNSTSVRTGYPTVIIADRLLERGLRKSPPTNEYSTEINQLPLKPPPINATTDGRVAFDTFLDLTPAFSIFK